MHKNTPGGLQKHAQQSACTDDQVSGLTRFTSEAESLSQERHEGMKWQENNKQELT